METGLGSPRSSSGYGSSEEDHRGCPATGRRRRATFAQHGSAIVIPAPGSSAGSSPHTPQSLSPSETGSSISSPNPFSIDFQSVFDEADLAGMPDFTDLAADALDDVELPADLWPGEMETWANELDRAGYVPAQPAAQVDDGGPTKRPDKRLLRDDSQILVSLLKRPKAELDWIATGHTPAPPCVDQFLVTSTHLGEQCVVGAQTNAVQVASASPLQRLKALTNSDVVNHVISQPLSSPRTPAVMTTAVSLSPAVPVRVVRQASLPRDGQMLIVRRKSASPTSSTFSVTSNSSSLVAAGISRRRPSAQKLVSLPRPGSVDRRRSSLAASSAPARTVAAPVAVRCVRSELDDHRYSTPMPPATAERPSHARSSSAAAKPSRPGRSSIDSRCPARRPSVAVGSRSLSTSSAASSSSSSSVLEMLLRTSKRLRPNVGSDVLLTTCRGGVSAKRHTPSRRRVVHQPANRLVATRTLCNPPATKLATFHDTVLPDLAGASASKGDAVDQAVTSAVTTVQASTASPSVELLSAASDCFTLFSEHLLCDSQGVIDVGLLSDDQSAWTPSRLDDKVISSELEEILREQVRQDDTWLQQYLSELL